MRRLVAALGFFAVGLFAVAGCASDGSNVGDAQAGTEAGSVVAPAGDFGSRYIGAPVAFWFWAPY